MNKNLIDALLEERRGYVVRGKKERLAAVDEQLRQLGYPSGSVKEAPVEVAAVESSEETAAAPKPRRRKVS